MNEIIQKEDVIAVIKSFLETNDGDESTTAIILGIGGELLDVSSDKMLEILDGADDTIPRKKMQMCARFKLEGNNIASVYTGGFNFTVNGKDIPFDFDASGTHKQITGEWFYESGYGAFFNEFVISDVYDNELCKIGVNPFKIDAKMLASATFINEFYVEALDNSGEELSVRVQLVDIYFDDRDSGERYYVNKDVVEDFNQRALTDE